LQLFHGIRSERQMMERLDFDLSFRWFVGVPKYACRELGGAKEMETQAMARFISPRPGVTHHSMATHLAHSLYVVNRAVFPDWQS
jgi:hypothetical protein